MATAYNPIGGKCYFYRNLSVMEVGSDLVVEYIVYISIQSKLGDKDVQLPFIPIKYGVWEEFKEKAVYIGQGDPADVSGSVKRWLEYTGDRTCFTVGPDVIFEMFVMLCQDQNMLYEYKEGKLIAGPFFPTK